MADDDIGTLRWFGDSWGAPVNDPRAQIPTPVMARCTACDVGFVTANQQGVAIPYMNGLGETGTGYYHRDCWLDEVLGTSWRRGA